MNVPASAFAPPSPLAPNAEAPRPSLTELMRRRMRLRHYSLRTEEAYVGWVKQPDLGTGSMHSVAVAAKDCTTTTPIAVSDDMAGILDGEVSAVAEKLAVNAEDWAECSVHLRG